MKRNLKPLRRALKAKKIRQRDVAVVLGVSESTASRYLHGHLPLSDQVLGQIMVLVEQTR